jgi:hypothetical protein
LARSKPRRDEWPERERAYRKKGFGSQSGADIQHRQADGWRDGRSLAVLSRMGTKDENWQKSRNSLILADQVIVKKKQHE